MKTKLLCLILFNLILIVSCSKDGDTGPQGPAGPQGAVGAQGPAGEDGEDGQDGNANVIASNWVEVDFGTEWLTPSLLFLSPYATHEIIDEQITQEVHDSYVMLSYIKATDGTANSLPVTYSILNDVTISSNFKIGSVTIQATKNSAAGSAAPPTNRSVRYVLIAPSSTTGKSKIPNFEKMTYTEVMDYFGLEH